MAPRIDRMDDRMDAVETALVAALPKRHVTRGWLRDYDAYPPRELSDGVVVLISAGEAGYKRGRGMVGKEGIHRMLLIGYLKVTEDDQPQAIEAAELDLIEEIKAFARSTVPGVGLVLDHVEHSRQLEHPYGWVVAYLDAGPPDMNVS